MDDLEWAYGIAANAGGPSCRTSPRATLRLILARVLDLAQLDDPRVRLKPLSGPLAGLWRYRVGYIRVILDVRVTEVVLVALDVGRRDSIHG